MKMASGVMKAMAAYGPALIATADKRGWPNGSAKGSLRVLDDEPLLFANIRSPRTVANLQENPQVAVVCLDAAARIRMPDLLHGGDSDGWGAVPPLDPGVYCAQHDAAARHHNHGGGCGRLLAARDGARVEPLARLHREMARRGRPRSCPPPGQVARGAEDEAEGPGNQRVAPEGREGGHPGPGNPVRHAPPA